MTWQVFALINVIGSAHIGWISFRRMNVLSLVCIIASAALAMESATFYSELQNSMYGWVASEADEFTGHWVFSNGIVANTPAARHAISAQFDSPMIVNDEEFVLQYEVTMKKELECGGAYIKVLRDSGSFSQSAFNNEDDYVIMFGPDKCGQTNKVHFILKHKNPVSGEYVEHHATNAPKIENDLLPHVYTLVIRPDSTYQIIIDTDVKAEGNLLIDLLPSIEPSALIDDPTDFKPDDWVTEAMIEDNTAIKPDDWDEDAPRMIPDPDDTMPDDWLVAAEIMVSDPSAMKPEDWDAEMDGEWEAPMIPNPQCQDSGCGPWSARQIPNPAYVGKWSSPMIANPAYVGEWTARQIDNPYYFQPKNVHNISPMIAVGFEIWTMQDGLTFSNVIVGKNPVAALEFAQISWKPRYDMLADAKKAIDEETATAGDYAISELFESAMRYPKMIGEFVQLVIYFIAYKR